MLKDVIQKVSSAIPSLFPVDPSQFNDPVAMNTAWKSLRSGNSSGSSSVLVQKAPDLLTYKPSMAGRVIGVIFCLAGIGAILLYFTTPVTGDSPWVLPLVGLAFALAGVFIFLQATSPVAFDKSQGVFYRGRKQQKMADPADTKHALRFADVHAVQILTKLARISANNNAPPRYVPVYEMNLVKHDGQRMNVITYSKVNRAREDARTIAEFIQVPVWDGTNG